MHDSIWYELKMMNRPAQYSKKKEEFAEHFFWEPDTLISHMFNMFMLFSNVFISDGFKAQEFPFCKMLFADDWKIVCISLPEYEDETEEEQICCSYALAYDEDNEVQDFYAIIFETEISAYKIGKLEANGVKISFSVLADTTDNIAEQAKDVYNLYGRNAELSSSYEKHINEDGTSTGWFVDYITNKSVIQEFGTDGNLRRESFGTYTQ